MTGARIPHVHAAGRWWSADLVASMAGAWLDSIDDRLGGDSRPCAACVPSTPEGLALFAAVSGRRAPVAILSPDPQFWPAASPLFEGMPLVLLPAGAPLADEARRRGFEPIVLDEPTATPRTSLQPLRTQGFIVQTSGSTGAPKPLFRPTDRLIAGATARTTALGLRSGDGFLGGVPFSSGQGVVHVVAAMALGGPIGILGPVDHREALAAIALPEFACWRATAHFADVLGRCPLRGVAAAPRVCLISSPVSRSVFDTFRDRFGVPLRGTYSSSETGAVAVDAGAPDDVRPGTVGRPLPGVELRISEHPDRQVDAGEVGRIWVRSAWQMAGYGVPPKLERPGVIDGWWPTRDLGALDAEGYLRLAGRADDCVRTRDGRLVNLEAVADALRSVGGVRAAVVLPVSGSAGSSFGAVLQCAPGITLESMREPIAATLPAWALPRRFVIVEELPRLPNGKPDRLGCLALLSGAAVGV